jgi:ApbE superfamily uncharacterized protein (UPF0280 family)
MTAMARWLPDGRRLHLQHGPIDLVIEAFGAPAAIADAYRRAAARFPTILPALVAELEILRRPLPPLPSGEGRGEGKPREANGVGRDAQRFPSPARSRALPSPDGRGKEYVTGPVACRMVQACWPHRAAFITPMAAVAGAVADTMLGELMAAGDLARAYVNNGGDIALHLAPGERLTAGLVADIAQPTLHGTIALDHASPVRGLATSGWRGRSFSRGIADAVTVLARTAAEADAAATMIANAVDIDHPAIRRAPAASLRDDSDLGDLLVTVDVGTLPPRAIAAALAGGARAAATLVARDLIHGAVLVLQGHTLVVPDGLAALTHDPIRESAA